MFSVCSSRLKAPVHPRAQQSSQGLERQLRVPSVFFCTVSPVLVKGLFSSARVLVTVSRVLQHVSLCSRLSMSGNCDQSEWSCPAVHVEPGRTHSEIGVGKPVSPRRLKCQQSRHHLFKGHLTNLFTGLGKFLHKWLRPGLVPPSPFLSCDPAIIAGGCGILTIPCEIDKQNLDAWLWG